MKSDYNEINLNFVPINGRKVLQQLVLHLANVRLSKSVSNQLKAEYQDPIYICELTKDITRWAVMLRPCTGPGKFSLVFTIFAVVKILITVQYGKTVVYCGSLLTND